MSVTLICDYVRWEEKEIVRAARRLEVDFEVLNIRRDQLAATESVALQRCVSFHNALNSSAVLESEGVDVVESVETIQICGNKLLTTAKLNAAGLPVPRTEVGFGVEKALGIVEELGFPCVLKPLIGSWGRLVTRIEDAESAREVLNERMNMGPQHGVFYLQEYVNGRDVRCLVVGGEVIGAMYREGSDDWRSNVALGGKVMECPLTQEIEELALSVTEAVGGHIVGVDLFESERGLLVNEVNHRPEFRGLSRVVERVPEKIIHYLGVER